MTKAGDRAIRRQLIALAEAADSAGFTAGGVLREAEAHVAAIEKALRNEIRQRIHRQNWVANWPGGLDAAIEAEFARVTAGWKSLS